MTPCRASADRPPRRGPVRRLALAGLLAGPLLLPVHADTTAGRLLFERQCSDCHRAGPGALRTPVAQIPALLKAGTVRRHRFSLTEDQLQELAAYLTGIKADGR